MRERVVQKIQETNTFSLHLHRSRDEEHIYIHIHVYIYNASKHADVVLPAAHRVFPAKRRE